MLLIFYGEDTPGREKTCRAAGTLRSIANARKNGGKRLKPFRLARSGTRARCSPKDTRTSPRLSRKRTMVALAGRATRATCSETHPAWPKNIKQRPPPYPASDIALARANPPRMTLVNVRWQQSYAMALRLIPSPDSSRRRRYRELAANYNVSIATIGEAPFSRWKYDRLPNQATSSCKYEMAVAASTGHQVPGRMPCAVAAAWAHTSSDHSL
jgi:hypothetical protein